jgi:hypothetical protein
MVVTAAVAEAVTTQSRHAWRAVLEQRNRTRQGCWMGSLSGATSMINWII